MLNLTLKSQTLTIQDGFRTWQPVYEETCLNPSETAIIIVDMWDRHWSRGATHRCGLLAEKINQVATAAREKGILIVHAPSDTMEFYKDAEARHRLFSVPMQENITEPVFVEEHPLPVDDSDGGSDTADDGFPVDTQVWTRQTEKIHIDQSRDVICGDEGDQLFSYLSAKGIKFILYMGVHTNLCILNRSFAIKPMLRRGMQTALVRDLTDAMYNPAKPPYVSHEEGTRLIVEFIEKKVCPTIDSRQLL